MTSQVFTEAQPFLWLWKIWLEIFKAHSLPSGLVNDFSFGFDSKPYLLYLQETFDRIFTNTIMLRSPAGMMSFPSNRMNHSESVAAVSPPDGPVSCLSFSPATLQQNFLVAGSSDCTIRCWGINTQTRESTPTVIQAISGPVLDVAWSDVSLPPDKMLFTFYMLIHELVLKLGWHKGVCDWKWQHCPLLGFAN